MSLSKKRTRSIPKPTFFGRNLKFLRRLHGLSQTQIAEKVGMKRNNIASYESGMVEPNIVKFLAVCSYFKVDTVEMLEKVMSENPVQTLPSDSASNGEVSQYLNNQVEEFIFQTNEMTKIFDGYKTFYDLKKQSITDETDLNLYTPLDQLLDILRELISCNWQLIHNIIPGEEE